MTSGARIAERCEGLSPRRRHATATLGKVAAGTADPVAPSGGHHRSKAATKTLSLAVARLALEQVLEPVPARAQSCRGMFDSDGGALARLRRFVRSAPAGAGEEARVGCGP